MERFINEDMPALLLLLGVQTLLMLLNFMTR